MLFWSNCFEEVKGVLQAELLAVKIYVADMLLIMKWLGKWRKMFSILIRKRKKTEYRRRGREEEKAS